MVGLVSMVSTAIRVTVPVGSLGHNARVVQTLVMAIHVDRPEYVLMITPTANTFVCAMRDIYLVLHAAQMTVSTLCNS